MSSQLDNPQLIRSLSQATEGENGHVGFQKPIQLPVCCLFSMSNKGSQPPHRSSEEPGNILKTLTFGSR